ncbi:MAG: type II toxin-antitoxin system RelB/DinJ family antitoxin [Endomicrobium sp.]|jgi:DNA-damage-inducible protein J|nr:type II toxin-antitoxin system RelB/DinJ family antitoxin [Endomicrobium sp.]
MKSRISVTVDKELKDKAVKLFDELGMNMSVAIDVFLRQCVRLHRMPFTISSNVPNPVTVAAIKEAERISNDPNAKRYSSFAEIMDEVLKGDV